jgi:DNA-binding NarL/FixJ family response regulator
VAIVDISLKNSSGIELIKELKRTCPGLPVLVLSMHEEPHYAERALRAGAMGYIMKSEAAKKVIEGIRSVNAGQVFVSEKIAVRMAQKFIAGKAGKTASPIEQLSDREADVFQLLGCGLNTQQIADHLHVGLTTIQTYCGRIKEKLNLDNATELLREAIHWHENQQQK